MRKVFLALVAVIIVSRFTHVTAQTALANRAPIDSSVIKQRAYRNIDSLTVLIQRTRDKQLLANLYLKRGISEGLVSQPDSAIKDYTAVIALNPNFADAYSFRGTLYQRQKKYEAAIADDEKAAGFLKNSPVRVAGLYGSIGFMQLKLKNYRKALTADSIALSINPNIAFVYESAAFAYDGIGKYDKAIENWDALKQKQKTHGNNTVSFYLTGRADSKLKTKRYKDAINDYLLALQLNPDNKDAYWNLAVAYNYNGDYELSANSYAKTITYYVGDNKSLAQLYSDKSREETAMQKIGQALRDDSLSLTYNNQYGPACWNMAYAYQQNGDFEQSLEWYRKTLKLYNDPKDQSTLNDAIAEGAAFLGHNDEVVQTSTKAIELDAHAWSPHLNRGRAYLKQGKNALALEDFNQVLALDTTKKSYEYAFALFYTGNNDKAIRLMQSNIVSTGDVSLLVNHYYNLACLYSLMNMPDEANTNLKKCIDGGYSKRYVQMDFVF